MAYIHLPAGQHGVDMLHERGWEPETSVCTLRAAALACDDTKCPHLSPACRPLMFPCYYRFIQLQMAPFILHTNE